MPIDAHTLSQFEMMIGALMSPDNNVRGQAEATFNQAKANPDILVSALVHLLRHNESEQVSWWHRSHSRTAALGHWPLAGQGCFGFRAVVVAVALGPKPAMMS